MTGVTQASTALIFSLELALRLWTCASVQGFTFLAGIIHGFWLEKLGSYHMKKMGTNGIYQKFITWKRWENPPFGKNIGDDSMAVGYNSRSSCYQKWVSPIHSIDRVGDEEHPGWIWIAKSVMQKIDFRKIWLAKSCVFAWDDFHRAEETELKKEGFAGGHSPMTDWRSCSIPIEVC